MENWPGQIVRTFQKRTDLKFQGNMRGGDHSYPGVPHAAWNFTKENLHQIYFPATYLK